MPYRAWIEDKDHSEHYEFKFSNGYGAEISCSTKGLFELVVNKKYRRYSNSPFEENLVTIGGIICLTREEVKIWLEKISDWKK
jgi:hypothetical protein